MPPPKDDDFEFEGFLAPSYTQVPDEAFDKLMARLSPAEFKVMMYIIRRTFGFKKGADAISISQIVSGIRTKDGTQLDMGTGLTRRGVTKALAELARRKVIVVERRRSVKKGFEATVYRLNIIGNLGNFPHPDDPRVQPLLQLPQDPRELSSLGLGNSVPQARELSSLEQETVVQDTEKQQQQPRPRRAKASPKTTPVSEPTDVVVASSNDTTTDTANDIQTGLAALGVAQSTIRSLLKNRDHTTVGRWVAYVEHKLASGWMPHESPAAWIVTAIRSGDWVIPDWFQTPEEQAAAAAQEVQLVEAERRRRDEEAELERRKAEQQRRAVESELGVGESTRETWERVQDLLRDTEHFSVAFLGSHLLPLNGRVATVVTSAPFFREVIEKRAEALCSVISEVSGKNIEVVEVKLFQPTAGAGK